MWLDGGHEFGGTDNELMSSASDLAEHMQRLLREEKRMQTAPASAGAGSRKRRRRRRRPDASPSNLDTPLVHDVLEHRRADGVAANHALIEHKTPADISSECTFRPRVNTYEFSRIRRSFLDEVELHAQTRKASETDRTHVS